MSRRDRVSFTRADSTGFSDNSRAVARLRTAGLDDELAAAKAKMVASQDEQLAPPVEKAPPIAGRDGAPLAVAPTAVVAPGLSDETSARPQVQAPRRPAKKLADEADADAAELVVPPGREPGMRFIFGLDVLERQVDALKALEATGVPIESVLRAAASKVDFRAVKLEYLPQVPERRSRGIQHRVNVRLPINFFSEVEKMVRGGEKASRKMLVAGQFEPAWFSALDDVIERMKR